MQPFMHVKRRLLIEPFHAKRAFVGFLSGMDSHMQSERRLLIECLLAHLTNEGLLSGVYPLVTLQGEPVVEALAAVRAYVIPRIGVRP